MTELTDINIDATQNSMISDKRSKSETTLVGLKT